jgi:low affinity Fe/Cu permease
LECPSKPPFDLAPSSAHTNASTTTIVTFLMAFLIQNTQNRDTEGLQMKTDEIARTLDLAAASMQA